MAKTGLEEGLRKHNFTAEESDKLHIDPSPKEVAEVLYHFKPGEYYEETFPASNNPAPIENYIKNLERSGLDIGKGNAEFGYKMPLPEKGQLNRKLIIFRRH